MASSSLDCALVQPEIAKFTRVCGYDRAGKKTREQFPFLPWREMIGLRNRLIQAYFDVNNQAIWLL